MFFSPSCPRTQGLKALDLRSLLATADETHETHYELSGVIQHLGSLGLAFLGDFFYLGTTGI